jgi:DNA-binding GntR family transcriptional regulator
MKRINSLQSMIGNPHPEPGQTKIECAARTLREALLRGDLVPGQKLTQQELAEWLDMSSTPVREVLRILVAEGLLEYTPNKGVQVAQMQYEGTEEISRIRAVLERLAVEEGALHLTEVDFENLEELERQFEVAWQRVNLAQVRRCNYEFHAAIYRSSGYPVLCAMIEKLWPRFPTDLLWMIPGRTDRAILQHRAILKAIRKGDPVLAGELLVEHILSAGNSIVEFLKTQSQSAQSARSADIFNPLSGPKTSAKSN